MLAIKLHKAVINPLLAFQHLVILKNYNSPQCCLQRIISWEELQEARAVNVHSPLVYDRMLWVRSKQPVFRFRTQKIRWQTCLAIDWKGGTTRQYQEQLLCKYGSFVLWKVVPIS